MAGPRIGLVAAAVAAILVQAAGAGAGEPGELARQSWSFAGPLGTYDQPALRRGLVVYQEACANCHSLRHVAYRDLVALGSGFGPEEVTAFAARFELEDGVNENGEPVLRPARPSDRFAPPYRNSAAARAANNGAAPPDLSLMAKARAGGPDFMYSFLVGYEDPPAATLDVPGTVYNLYAPGRRTAMPQALFEGAIEFDDDTPATIEQMASDVTSFLAWAADPHMEERKALGLRVVAFLALLSLVLIALKWEIWSDVRPLTPEQTP